MNGDDYRRLIQDEIGLLGEVVIDHPELRDEISPIVEELKVLFRPMMN